MHLMPIKLRLQKCIIKFMLVATTNKDRETDFYDGHKNGVGESLAFFY